MFFLTACNYNEQSNNISHICIMDIDGNEVKNIDEYVYSNQTSPYKPNNIFVYAVYTLDNEMIDVTKDAIFSNVDLSKAGQTVVTVYYMEFSTSYILNIIEIGINKIEVNIDSAKLIYETGDLFSNDNIVTTVYYEESTVTQVDNYGIEITNEKIDHLTPLIYPGFYDAKIKVGKGEYTITCSYDSVKIYSIYVNSFNVDNPDVVKIELDTINAMKVYNLGDVLNTEGIVLHLIYENGNDEIIDISNAKIAVYHNDIEKKFLMK